MLTKALDNLDLPLSPIFIDFLARWMDGSVFDHQPWPDQLSEELSNNRAIVDSAEMNLDRLSTSQVGHDAIEDVYRWFREFAMGKSDLLVQLHKQYDFMAIVGIARTGGSYLTTELFAALGFNPEHVPSGVAHDGFPDARPFNLRGQNNSWIDTLMRTSEYLVMVERYFAGSNTGKRIIPKKLTKAVYAGSFFKVILGINAEYLVTIRHPIACCISTYDKSGGFPADGRFKIRSTIERWVQRDLIETGISNVALAQMDYFDAYVRYWEQFHINLALSGLLANGAVRIVAFGKESMEEVAQSLHTRFHSNRSAASFVARTGRDAEHVQWIERSEQAMDRVEAAWSVVGLPFPRKMLATCS
jgi:hypothetical protein